MLGAGTRNVLNMERVVSGHGRHSRCTATACSDGRAPLLEIHVDTDVLLQRAQDVESTKHRRVTNLGAGFYVCTQMGCVLVRDTDSGIDIKQVVLLKDKTRFYSCCLSAERKGIRRRKKPVLARYKATT